MIIKPKCGSCGYWNPKGSCKLGGAARTAEDFCSDYCSNPPRCDRCNGIMRLSSPGIINPITNGYETLCGNCFRNLGHCASCKNGQYCAFEQDTNCTEPKQVQQTVRQGVMIMNTLVKNPARIGLTCRNGCPCSDGNMGCLRDADYCKNYR